MKTYFYVYRKFAGPILFFVFATLVATWGFSESASQKAKKQRQDEDQREHARTVVSRDPVVINAAEMIKDGRQIFRFDTYGDEAFWGGTLRLHEAIEGAQHGGTGPGVSPSTALAVGLKVDVDALPARIVSQ